MADLSLFQGGGEIPVGGAVMLVDNRNDFTTADGQRFLRSGFVETATAGIDTNIISEGAYYEQSNTPTAWVVTNNYFGGGLYVGQTGIAISNTAVRNLLIAETTTSPFVEISSPYPGGFNIGNVADNNGNIITIFGSNGNISSIFRSTDFGATFTNVYNTGSMSSFQGFLSYSTFNGEFVYVATGFSGIYYSSDGITWSLSGTTFSGLMTNGASLCAPESAGDPWLLCTTSSTTAGRLYKSVDGGATWQQIGTQGTTQNAAFPTNQFAGRAYRIAGKTFVAVAGTGHATSMSVYEIDTNAVAEKDLVIETYSFTNTSDDTSRQLLRDIFFERNGRSLTNNNKIIINGLSTIDGITAKRESFQGSPQANDGTHWYIGSGINGGNVLYVSKPYAGSVLSYSEAGATQFVRIS